MTLPIVVRLMSLAEAALGRGAVKEAVAIYQKVVVHDPYHPKVCAILADYHEATKSYREAALFAGRLGGGHGGARDPRMLLREARLHALAGDPVNAARAYENILVPTDEEWTLDELQLQRLARRELKALVARREADEKVRKRQAAPPMAAGSGAGRPESPEEPRVKPPEVVVGATQHGERTGVASELDRSLPPPPVPVVEPIAVRTVVDDPEWRFLEAPAAGGSRAVPGAGAGGGGGAVGAVGPVGPVGPGGGVGGVGSVGGGGALGAVDCLDALRLRLDFHRLTLLRDYDDLVCLPTLVGVERFWYQVETVKKVLRDFRGRVLLADEVGLGKTIEAAMALKEFILRGLARSVLVLTPPGLVAQWKEELGSKFGLEFVTTDDVDPAADPSFWDGDRLIASMSLARSKAHAERVAAREYDLVIVDEAHRLKNRGTLAWKLVNSLKKKYVFLLSATPVENDLIELYNLITLLKPGALKTEADFRRAYTKRGDPREAKNPEALRELLRTVMIRNTRSLVDVKLPKRFAVTLLVDLPPAEREIYDGVTALVRARSQSPEGKRGSRLLLSTLLREAGSSPRALRGTLVSDPAPEALWLLERIDALGETAKAQQLVRLLAEKPGEKVIVFTQFRKSLDELSAVLARHGVGFTVYHGGLPHGEKEGAIRRFRDEVPVLLATESGGEGHNLQFASVIVNYDLPWNPMKIEQRIGRLHRIGQTRDVFVFNLAGKETLEHRLLDVLHRKINLFELVVGEVDMILGNLEEEKDFDDVVFDLWRGAASHGEAEALFEELGEKLVRAKETYRASQKLDEALFSEDFEA